MTRQIRVLDTESDNWHLIPGSHIVEGQNYLLQVVFDLHMYHGIHVSTHTYIYTSTHPTQIYQN